jgi:dipeptidyl aminopeptidase/acylaminoacyl peptidase
MRRLVLASLVSMSVAPMLATAASAAASADVYGSNPDVSSVVISPDGNHIAMVRPISDRGGVNIIRLGGGQCAVSSGNELKVHSVFWVSSTRLAIEVSFTYAADLSRRDDYLQEIFRYLAVDATCKDPQWLLGDNRDAFGSTGSDFIGRTKDGKLLFSVLNIAEMTDNPYGGGTNIKKRDQDTLDIYAVDPTTLKSSKVISGNAATVGWITDPDGSPRVRVDIDPKTREQRAFARVGSSSDWTQVYSSAGGGPELSFAAMAAKPDVAYVESNNGGDKSTIYEFDLKTKSLGSALFRSNRVDVSGLVFDDYSNRPVGVAYTDDYPTRAYFDRGYAQMQADVMASLSGVQFASVVSASSDLKKYVAYVEGPQYPTGSYQLVDMTQPAIGEVGARYPSIPASDVGPVKSFTYKSRDGLTIPAYLTLPRGSTAKNLPLVVLPHGGPGSRDDASFDPWTQFLASRGYAVLQPQFRGSSGFGASHLKAGRFKWGLEMQNDITDGVKHLVADGTADASRVCIFGWSYGGYAAMAGLAFTPELYKCGVAGAGISDLQAFVGELKKRGATAHNAGKFWLDSIGDPQTDTPRLIATSPAKHAGNVRAPLLLVHGRDDSVVPFVQSQIMAGAMRNAGKQVQLVELEGADHWLVDARTKRRMLQEVETFLAKHLK